jgi:microcystin-dependent protein
MGTPYVGEIRMFAGNFNPAGWMLCQGQQLPISGYETLFNLIGTTYGGDGQNNFNLPNLQSRLPVHMGTSPSLGTYTIGEAAGVEEVTLTTQQIPRHNHNVNATNTGQQLAPSGTTMPASATPGNNRNVYGPAASNPVTMANGMIGMTGGNQPHSNIQPVLAINFIISLYGIYPSPT